MSLDYNITNDSYGITELPLNYDWVPVRDTEFNGANYTDLKDGFVFDLNALDNDFVDLSRLQLRGKLLITSAYLADTEFDPPTEFADRNKMADIQVNAPLRAFTRSVLKIDQFHESINEPNEVYNYHLLAEHNPKYVQKFSQLTGVPLPNSTSPKTGSFFASTDSGYLRADVVNDALPDAEKYKYIEVPFIIPLANLHKSLRLLPASRGLPVQLELHTQKDSARVYLTSETDDVSVRAHVISNLELWCPRMLMPELNEAKLERTISTSNSALKAYGFSQHFMSPLITSNAYTYNIPPQKNRVVKVIVYFTDQVEASIKARSQQDLEFRKIDEAITHLVLRQNNKEVKNNAYHFTTNGDLFRIYNDFLESHGYNVTNPVSEPALGYESWLTEQQFYAFDCNINANDKLNNLSIRVEFGEVPSTNMHVILVNENEMRLSSDEDSRLLCQSTAGQSLKY